MKPADEPIFFPVDRNGWFLLHRLGKKVVIRATSIKKRKQRITDTDGHGVDEAIAEGGVKVRSKLYDISKF